MSKRTRTSLASSALVAIAVFALGSIPAKAEKGDVHKCSNVKAVTVNGKTVYRGEYSINGVPQPGGCNAAGLSGWTVTETLVRSGSGICPPGLPFPCLGNGGPGPFDPGIPIQLSVSSGSLRCISKDGKGCTERDVKAVERAYNAEAREPLTLTLSRGGTVMCAQANGQACTPAQVGIVGRWNLKRNQGNSPI